MNYVHGGDIYRNSVEYDFSVNINPLGMPKGSVRAARQGILLCSRYPDCRGERLCEAIAAAEGVKREQVLPGNGAAELIYALCYALRPGRALGAAPSFQEYEAAVAGAGGKMSFWNLDEREGFRLGEGFLSALSGEADILFLCNPNNPTGSLTDRSLLERIAQKCGDLGMCFCLDECFLPFLEREEDFTMKGWLERFPHMVILRAFTKIYGMPGLRLGYALSAGRELLERMERCMQPWNTSIPAQMAGEEALKDRDYLERTRRLLRRERGYLRGELSAGLVEKVYDSPANYIFFKSAPGLRERLLERKILIRSCQNYRNLGEEYFRIGIRTRQENRELIRRWRETLELPGREGE